MHTTIHGMKLVGKKKEAIKMSALVTLSMSIDN